jgi:hypothetical protein
MKFLLAPIALSDIGDRDVALSAWKEKTVPKLVQYMKSDAYYRIDGHPLLIDFGVNYRRGEDEIPSYAALREAVKAALGVDPLIVRMLPAAAKYGDMAYFQKMVHPDGFACFSHAITGSPEPYAQYIADWIPQMTAQIAPSGRSMIVPSMFIPCGSIGSDSRPWYQIGHGAPGGPNAMKFTEGTTPALFREHLESLKGYIDQHRALTKGLAILYAWNEWGEAAADIEPSATGGYAYADVVREVFRLQPRAAKP